MKKIFNVGNRVMNTYVYHTSSGYVMVDTGYQHSLKSVEEKLKKLNISLMEIKYLFLTHAHDDHAGFLNELLIKNKELKVIMSAKAMPTLKRGQNPFNGACSGFVALIFCRLMAIFGNADHRFPRIEDKHDNRLIIINDENKSELEDLLQGKILFTPGHTEDSISLKKDNIIFCGDAAMNGFPSIKRLIIWIEDKEQFEQSWNVLIAEDAEMIYPAHGKPFNKNDLIRFKNTIKRIKMYSLKTER